MRSQETDQEQESKSNRNLESNANESSHFNVESDGEKKKSLSSAILTQSSSLENSPLLCDETKHISKTTLPSFQNVSNVASLSKTISTICHHRISQKINSSKSTKDPYLYHDVESSLECGNKNDERLESVNPFSSKNVKWDTNLNKTSEYSGLIDTSQEDVMRCIQNEEARDNVAPDQVRYALTMML